MGKISEVIFYALSPFVWLWVWLSVDHDYSACQTIGCFIGDLVGTSLLAFLPVSVGLVLRRSRKKKEKAKQQTE